MAIQIIFNLLIAVLWMFMTESYTFVTFLIGYIIGIALLFLLRRFIPDAFYFKRVLLMIKLILLFLKELIGSTWQIAKLVYKPKLNVEPGIFALPTELRTNWEITLLANLISLTPGTLSVSFLMIIRQSISTRWICRISKKKLKVLRKPLKKRLWR